MTETEVRTNLITPALRRAGWGEGRTYIREEEGITAGRIEVIGEYPTRGSPLYADYVLYYQRGIPLAIVEAKKFSKGISGGLQQAETYARMKNVPFAFSSNGQGFKFTDLSGDSPNVSEIGIDEFPRPEYLWNKYLNHVNIPEEGTSLITSNYYSDGQKTPRYYQSNAINAAIEAVARGQKRLLMVMATGTGKTYTAFQIIWRLWTARRVKRVLFLADRNILVDQSIVNDFKPFKQKGILTKIRRNDIDLSYEIYMALYQSMTGPEDYQKTFKSFDPDFFDMVVIDECHRGSAAEDSAWREILEYFDSSIQIGFTATPKETKYVSNIDYFGDPVYEYGLKQGIDDGFLAPFRVIRITFDKDAEGWRPIYNQSDRYGKIVEDKVYERKDFDRGLILEERTRLVAEEISDQLKRTDRMAKTIVFCENIDHAERMRQALINENPDMVSRYPTYVVKITGDDTFGKSELDNFILPDSEVPVIATTSKLLSTGVDAQTCKVIAIDKEIGSMTEFKQIIGRGTRIREDQNKMFFTIMDFRRVTDLFAEGLPDDVPEVIFDPETPRGKTIIRKEPKPQNDIYYVNDVVVEVISSRVEYLDPEGRLITKSITDYTLDKMGAEFEDFEDFIEYWKASERKSEVIEALKAKGVIFEALRKEMGSEYGPFDLICHLVYDKPAFTRRERVERLIGDEPFNNYSNKARKVLELLLHRFSEDGLRELDNMETLRLNEFQEIGTPLEILSEFDGRDGYLQAIRSLEDQLYTIGD